MQDGDTADPSRDPDLVGRCSCVTRFIRMLLGLLEHSARSHQRHLTEYFALLLEFAKMGEEECRFLVCVRAVSTVANFYLGQRGHDIDIVSRFVKTLAITVGHPESRSSLLCFAK